MALVAAGVIANVHRVTLPRRSVILAPWLLPTTGVGLSCCSYPTDRTPEGAYLRVVKAVTLDKPEEIFAYLETDAQHACYTIAEYRRKSLEHVRSSFPAAERARWARQYEALANAADGKDVFAYYARREGWLEQLRRDLSGISGVERQGNLATIRTFGGTLYPFKMRPENGIFGLTLFTSTLTREAERAARDHQLILRAAEDYLRAGSSP